MSADAAREDVSSIDYWMNSDKVMAKTGWLQVGVAAAAVILVLVVAGKVIREALCILICLAYQFYSQPDLRTEFFPTVANNFAQALEGDDNAVIYAVVWVAVVLLLAFMVFSLADVLGSREANPEDDKGLRLS